jgi:hypothetical protein
MDFIQYHNSVAGNRCQVHKIKREKAMAGDIIDEKIMRKRFKRVRQAILFSRIALVSARSFHVLRGASSPATKPSESNTWQSLRPVINSQWIS